HLILHSFPTRRSSDLVHTNIDAARHLREAAEWLKRAQDYGVDRGVAYGSDFGHGFLPSYPETTEYIICTFLRLSEHYQDPDFFNRAVAMGEWETAIQMPSGAVMGGVYNSSPTPAVFNTGMVLLGWASLFRKTADSRFKEAGARAAQWLMQMQEPNGEWIRGNSQFANPRTTVYNVKAAWGLAEMGAALGEDVWIKAAVRNAEFAISKQLPNGWFNDCCLEDGNCPLLHTIAYTMQGLIGIGKISGREEFIEAAARTADALLKLMDANGFIPGKIHRDFRGAVNWCCLTGTAQTSIVWSQLEKLLGQKSYAVAAEHANAYLMIRHDINNCDLSIRGGVAGSWPVWGSYGRFKVLNWATKFFLDALLERVPISREMAA